VNSANGSAMHPREVGNKNFRTDQNFKRRLPPRVLKYDSAMEADVQQILLSRAENCAVPCGIRFLKAQVPGARPWAAQRAFCRGGPGMKRRMGFLGHRRHRLMPRRVQPSEAYSEVDATIVASSVSNTPSANFRAGHVMFQIISRLSASRIKRRTVFAFDGGRH
jgi:hypothetical protein